MSMFINAINLLENPERTTSSSRFATSHRRGRQANLDRLRRHIITVRNDKVSRSVQDKYRSHPIAANPKTFCVSNRIYWSQREKPVSSALPYLQLSGILDLRRHCIGIVAESHLRATTEYIKDEIPAFLGSVALWVEAGFGNASTERKQQILEAVSTIQRELEEVFYITFPLIPQPDVIGVLGVFH